MLRTSIVINREFGSGGREIGRRLSEQERMEFYDTRILQDAASSHGIAPNALAALDEKLSAGQFLDMSALGGSNAGTLTVPYVLYSATADVITAAATTRPAVFIGRCADRILHDAHIPFLNVFIFSTNIEKKIARATRVDGVAPRDAKKYIAKMDKARSHYQQFFTGTRFGDYHQYDLCLNSAHLGYTGCVDSIRVAAQAGG